MKKEVIRCFDLESKKDEHGSRGALLKILKAAIQIDLSALQIAETDIVASGEDLTENGNSKYKEG